MNDRAVNLLEHYDMEVIRTFKGRDSLICETKQGYRVFKEYRGKTEKLLLLQKLQEKVSTQVHTDILIPNKEGELFCKDTDGTVYILKKQPMGNGREGGYRECSYKNEEDIEKTFSMMARVHKEISHTKMEGYDVQSIASYREDMIRHTNECRHVRNYLRQLKRKTEFEKALLKEYNYFLEKAIEVTELAMQEDMEEYRIHVEDNGLFCHGDFQYHNVLFERDSMWLINLEHFAKDSGIRDFYLLFRKISEKSDWSIPVARLMLDAYRKEREIEACEWRQLELRLRYPEKFWKIINFYYNSKKSWIPDKNLEKLELLIQQEKSKDKLIQTLFS